MKTISVYGGFFALCFLGFFSSVHAQTVDIKIDFARVQDISGEQPNKTAACIIAWVAGDAEEKVFCRYQLDKETGFFRDNTSVNKILYKNQLLTATSQEFPKKIKSWLDDIEKGLSGKKLPPIQPTISQLFADFLEQGVKDYSAYSGYEEGLFKSTKPHNLVLLKKLDETDITFAFIVHYEVHRAVSESGKPQTPKLDKKPGSEPSTTPVKPDAKTPLNNPKVDNLLSKPEIQELLTNQGIVTFLQGLDDNAFDILTDDNLRALVVKHAKLLKTPNIEERLNNIEKTDTSDTNPKPTGGDDNSESLKDKIDTLVRRLLVVGALSLLLLVVIFWRIKKSQKGMDVIVGELNRQVDDSYNVINKTYTKVAEVKTAIADQKLKVWQERETQQQMTETKDELSQTQQVDAIARQVATKLSEIIIHLNKNSKVDLLQKIQNALSNEKMSLKEDEIKRIAKAVTLDAQSKQEILDAISAQNTKVQQEHEQLERSRMMAENKLTETQQHLTKTEGELSQTKTKLLEVQNQHKRMTESLQTLMEERFGVIQLGLLPQLSKQEGTWRWLQNVLAAQYNNSYDAFLNVENLHEPECDKIIELLNIKSILTHWHDFITDNPHFESDQRLLGLLEARDAGMWLSNVLRADELLKTYFSDKTQLKSLATPLAIAAIMLQAALQELGVEVTKPVLLESPPATLPKSARKEASNPLLMELVHGKVMPKLQSEKTGKLVVDIERYGFVTQGTPKTAMKVLVAELGGWEFYSSTRPK
ncbi:MAG: hypothetical protein ABFS56_23735 [Pseudomonadota bacterium]